MLTSTNVEIFVWRATAAVIVEERTGVGLMIKKTRGTAVFHQTLTVPKIVMTSGVTMLTARQEFYYPGALLAMEPAVAVQSPPQSLQMMQRLISSMTYKTALPLLRPQV